MRISYFLALFFVLLLSCQNNSHDINYSNLKKQIREIENSSIGYKEKNRKLDSIFTKYVKNVNNKHNRGILFEIAGVAYNTDYQNLYQKSTNSLIQLSKKAKDTAHIAKAYHYLGDFYEDNYRLDSAYAAYSFAGKYYSAIHDTLQLGIMQKSKAIILYEEGLYTQAETEAFNAVKNISKFNNNALLFESYTTIANILDQSSQTEVAIMYNNKALDLLKNFNSKDNQLFYQATLYNNIGYLYNNLENYDLAEKTFKEGIALLNEKLTNSLTHAMLLNNLAYSYIKKGKLSAAEQLVNKSFRIRDSIKSPQGLIASYNRKGELFLAKKDTIKAVDNWAKAYKEAEKIKARNAALENLKFLSLYDKHNAKIYAERYYEINDSIKNMQIENKTKFARIEFETDQLEQKNELLSQRLSLSAILVITSLLISILIYITFKQKILQKKLIYEQNKQNDKELIYKLILQQEEVAKNTLLEERNRISTELHDGIINTLFNIRLMLTNEQNPKNRSIINAEIEEAQQQIRRISHNLQDQKILMGSFTPILEELITKNNNPKTEFILLISRNFDWSIFNYETKMNFYRIIQECIQNVIKHANCTRCIISIIESVDSYRIKVQDNGIGFKINEVKKGIGLKNIERRVNNLKGELIVNSNSKGTIIEVIVEKKCITEESEINI